jgi:hypothetical protein
VNEVSSTESANDRLEPHLDFPPAVVVVTPAPTPPEALPVRQIDSVPLFEPDRPDPDAWISDPLVEAAAELVSKADAATPISLAFLGGPGAGKSSALARFSERAGALASEQGVRLETVRVEAADSPDEPDLSIAASIYEALAHSEEAGGRLASAAREAAASLQDAHAVAREAADRLAELRQTSEAERANLESLSGRRARLAETVLFETPGSRVDSFARAHRVRIESRLRAFGFEGDLLATWKEFVREMAERNPLSKAAASLQALWAYRGQGRLLALTILFALLAWGFDVAGATRASWVGSVGSNVGAWVGAHGGAFATATLVCAVAAALCFAFDVVRAARFLNPIYRGATLLAGDIEGRRRDLDALIAHQTRRVDLKAKEVEAQGRRAEEAERRAQGPRAAVSHLEELRAFYGDSEQTPAARARFARGFLASLERVIRRDAPDARLLVLVDGLETLAGERVGAFLAAAGRLLARPGFIAAFALDDRRLVPDASSLAEPIERAIALPIRVDVAGRGFEGPPRGFAQAPDEAERRLLQDLAPLAGDPRRARRFANAYRLARASLPAEAAGYGALALTLLDTVRGEALDSAEAVAARQALAQAGFTSDGSLAYANLARRFGFARA